MKRISAYEIALSALACALATIMLTMGIFSKIFLFTGYLCAGFALMLPLAKKSYRGYVLAYIASCALSLIFNAARFFEILPFIAFFGLHPLVNELLLKTKINSYVAFALKAVWFDGTMYLIWRFVFQMMTAIPLVDKFIIPALLVFGTAVFFAYDYCSYRCRGAINGIVNRFLKK